MNSNGNHVPPVSWRLIDGALHLPVDEAEWWGASLGILVAAVHHPALVRRVQPDTDPVEVARTVLRDIERLYTAAARAASQADADSYPQSPSPSLRRDGDEVVLSPGVEIGHLAWCLEVFATAVLEPTSADARTARGATAYAAAAWSREIGLATGAL